MSQSPIAKTPGTLVRTCVGDDVAALVGLDAGRLGAEVVGVGAPAGRDQKMRAGDFHRLAAPAVTETATLSPRSATPRSRRRRSGCGSRFALENFADCDRDVLVLARDQIAGCAG